MAPSPFASLPERPYLRIAGGLLLAAALALAGCSTTPPRSRPTPPPPPPSPSQLPEGNWFALLRADHAQEIVIFALGLLDTGYRFGGANPDAGLDCSGMVAYIFERAAGLRVSGSAADIAKLGLQLMERTDQGVWQPATKLSPWWSTVRKPNGYQNRIQFVELWILSKLLYGNTYALKQRDERGVVRRLEVVAGDAHVGHARIGAQPRDHRRYVRRKYARRHRHRAREPLRRALTGPRAGDAPRR